MPPGQSIDFSKRSIDLLSIKPLSSFEERDLVAKVAGVRTSARHHDRVRHQIEMALDQVASDRRRSRQCSYRRTIYPQGAASLIIIQEDRPRVFTRTQENRVCVARRLLRQRRYVQPAKRNVCAF